MFWTVDLETLLGAALLARLLTLGWLFERCARHILAGYAPVFSSLEAGSLLRFGGWVTVSSLVGPIMVLLDKFVIGAAAGAQAVTHYTVPFQLGDRTTIISTALAGALFPRLAGAAPNEQQRLALDGQRVIAVVLAPLMSGAMLLIGPFLGWWIDPVFAGKSALLGQLLLLAFWFNSFAKIPYAQLQARGRADLVARCHLMEVLPYLGLLYVGLNTLGLAGAAIAFVLRIFMDFVLLAWLAGTLKTSLRILLVPSMLILVALFVAMGTTSGEAAWMVMAICQLIVTVLWAWRQSPPGIREPVAVICKPLANRLVRS
jgi:O-antigen/teichoic acid export membrane protein